MRNREFDFTDAQLLRLKAEKQLKVKQDITGDTAINIEEKRLMHELQVHQIELEMQNEELQRANQVAEAALKKYTLLYDFAPMGYFTLDSKGTICDLNFTGAELLNDRRISLMGANLKSFISNDSKDVFGIFLSKIYAENEKESCEIVFCCNDKPLCPVYIEGLLIGDEQKCLLSVVDTSGFKKN